jgi:copper chaperone
LWRFAFCAHTIRKSLEGIAAVSAVDVNPEKGKVIFRADPGLRPKVAETLRAIGYPETGSVHGLAASAASAMSLANSAIGKLGQGEPVSPEFAASACASVLLRSIMSLTRPCESLACVPHA